jgi:hypothetical protein
MLTRNSTILTTSSGGTLDLNINDFSDDEKVMVSSYSVFVKYYETKHEHNCEKMKILYQAIHENEQTTDAELDRGYIMKVSDVRKIFSDIEPQILCKVRDK